MARIYIDRYTGKLERTDLYLVKLTLKDGTEIENLEPRRLFPITNAGEYISLVDTDEKEVGLVRAVEELDEESAKALTDCFEDYYMIPKIVRLLSVDDSPGVLAWKVETDRGTVSFRIHNRNSDIKRLYGTNRVIIRDSNDNRYEIPDYTKLEPHSQHLLFGYI